MKEMKFKEINEMLMNLDNRILLLEAINKQKPYSQNNFEFDYFSGHQYLDAGKSLLCRKKGRQEREEERHKRTKIQAIRNAQKTGEFEEHLCQVKFTKIRELNSSVGSEGAIKAIEIVLKDAKEVAKKTLDYFEKNLDSYQWNLGSYGPYRIIIVVSIANEQIPFIKPTIKCEI